MTDLSLVGIYGGTFDPIHYGHLRVAEELVDAINFDQFFFVPAGTPRLRDAPIASKYHRSKMVDLSIRNNSRFSLDKREINRSGVSTTIESLREYQKEYNGQAALCFVMGADSFLKIHHWYLWHEIFQLCHLIVVDRPGSERMKELHNFPQEIQDACSQRWITSSSNLTNQSSGLIYIAQTTLLDISATRIRALTTVGKSIRYLLSEAVVDYIKTQHLYSGEDGIK